MDEPLFFLLLQAIIYAALNLGFRTYLRQPLISAALGFWFGWLFLLVGGLIAERNGWARIGTDFSPYLVSLFDGAFFGFTVGSFISIFQRSQLKYHNLVKISKRFFDKFGTRVLAALFIIGSIIFAQRLGSVGLDASYLSEVRSIYNERSSSLLLQVGSHLSVLTIMFIILRGVYDSYHGINMRMLVLTILCGAPLGLANGGRMFLMSYLLAYLASFLLSRSSFSDKRFNFNLREASLIGTVFSSLLVIFAIMGFIRGGYGHELDILYAVIIWPVSTLGAMDSWVYSAITSEKTYGINTFGWLFDFLSRIGVIDISSANSTMRETVEYFRYTSNSAAVIPRSILPDLIFDFGASTVFFSMMIVAIVLEAITSSCAGRGVFLHILAVQCLVASFSTIQNSVVSPGFAVTIFWAAIFSQLASQYRWRQ